MEEERQTSLPLPLSFGGVAALAHAPSRYLFRFQLLIALLAAAAVVAFFELGWAPVIVRVIAQLPAIGEIRGGHLTCTPSTPVRDASSSFLWITIDPTGSSDPGEGADLQIELSANEFRFRSLLGYMVLPYPTGVIVAVNRPEVEPWWGAWHPAIAVGLGAGVLVFLALAWTLMSAAYAWPVRLISFYADRQLTVSGSWRLAAAALLPGALLLVLALVGYTTHHLNLVQLLAAAIIHLIMSWIYVLGAPFCLPRTARTSPGVPSNPFGNGKQKPANPFAAKTPRRGK